MSKKNKVLLSSIGLVLLSGIAATSSTFAWFSSVRTASISYNDATVGTKSSDLTIAFRETGRVTGISQSSLTDNVLSLTGINKITDISGDGISFYKPVWSATAGIASAINEVVEPVGYFIEIGVTVSREANSNGLKVYLGQNTAIAGVHSGHTEVNPLNDRLEAATRLAVLNGAADAIIHRWAPVAEAGAKYLSSGTGAYGSTTVGITTDSALKQGDLPLNKTTVVAADADGWLVADLTSVESLPLTFRVWIEGEDTQTINEIIGGVLNVTIDLYALEVVA